MRFLIDHLVALRLLFDRCDELGFAAPIGHTGASAASNS
jgi:hypothetical protein